MNLNKIIDFKILEQYKIQLRFQDEETTIVDFKPLIGVGISALLLEPLY